MSSALPLPPELERVLITRPQLRRRVTRLGRRIAADYAGKNLVLVTVLRGGAFFLTELALAIDLPLTVDFLAISGFPGATVQPGVVQVLKDLEEDLVGKDVLLVEDVVDTGLTLAYILRLLRARRPASLEVCSLLDKNARRIVDIPLRYVGFQVPDVFVVGYGLDYRQRFRNLPFIGVLREQVLADPSRP